MVSSFEYESESSGSDASDRVEVRWGNENETKSTDLECIEKIQTENEHETESVEEEEEAAIRWKGVRGESKRERETARARECIFEIQISWQAAGVVHAFTASSMPLWVGFSSFASVFSKHSHTLANTSTHRYTRTVEHSKQQQHK